MKFRSRIPVQSIHAGRRPAAKPGATGSNPESARPRPAASAARLDELQVQARYARQKSDLYKAKAYGPHLTSPARMSELEREAARAEARFRFARTEADGAPPG